MAEPLLAMYHQAQDLNSQRTAVLRIAPVVLSPFYMGILAGLMPKATPGSWLVKDACGILEIKDSRDSRTILEKAVMQLKWDGKLDLGGVKNSRWVR